MIEKNGPNIGCKRRFYPRGRKPISESGSLRRVRPLDLPSNKARLFSTKPRGSGRLADGGEGRPQKYLLVMQDDAEEAAMDRQPAAVAVVNKTQLPELVHEMTDSRPGCANHL